ncbi:translation initiation factor eIF4e [Dacryopinax primogenitus]|uniref:Eukaryotic translation initiation factor 4E n=1 Tax=Dacryopinax primogenitus (strain DJM 731) TaxID=1858805 RepID=M5G2E3_DACPD|nr:translation initiation factor eIF4e [Dacryopinax primogenitus]EJT97937.1 translation initiation factor eIF4e [Dacryopinax primogenitus]
MSTTTTASTLPAPAAQASRAALEAALADKTNIPPPSGAALNGISSQPAKKRDELDELPDFEGEDDFPEITPQPELVKPTNGTDSTHATVGGLDEDGEENDELEDGEEEDGEIEEHTQEDYETRDVAQIMEEQEDRIRTVFDDPNGFNVKHPLFSSWTLWFDSPATKGRNLPPTPLTSAAQSFPPTPGGVPPTPGGGSWMDDIKKVITFDSVEEFWGLYNNIVPPSTLSQKANYYLFREGIIPAWEDAANKDGGKWSIQLPKDKTRPHIDKMWLYTMLAAIGETFDPPHAESTLPPQSLITGVIVSTRPQFYRISIWTRSAPASSSTSITNYDPAAEAALTQRIMAIGAHFKTSVLGYDIKAKLTGGLSTEVEFQSHKESEKKQRGQSKKLIV